MTTSPDCQSHSPRTVLAVVVAVQIAGGILAQVMAYFAPQVTEAIGTAPTTIGYVLASLTAATTLSMAIGGRIADRAGRRGTFILGAFVASVAGAGVALTSSLWLLVASLAVYGLIWGAVLSSGAALSFMVAPPGRQGLFVAFRQQGLPASALLVSLALPLAATNPDGWRWVILVQSSACLICAVACLSVLPTSPSTETATTRYRSTTPVRLIVFGGLGGATQWAFIAFWPLFILSSSPMPQRWKAAALIMAPISAGSARLLFGVLADRGVSLQRLLIAPLAVGGAALVLVASTSSTYWSSVEALVMSAILGCGLLGWNGIYVLILGRGAGSSSVASRVGSGLAAVRAGSIAGPPAFGAVNTAFGWRTGWSLMAIPIVLAVLGIRHRLPY